jgi:5'-nucleotidase
LENGVSTWGRFDGRWPFVSGITFTFDCSKPPGEQIDPASIMTKNGPIDLNKDYTVGVKCFVALGGDGYGCLTEGTKKTIVGEN